MFRYKGQRMRGADERFWTDEYSVVTKRYDVHYDANRTIPGRRVFVYADDRSETIVYGEVHGIDRAITRAKIGVGFWESKTPSKTYTFFKTIGTSLGTVGKEISGSKRVPGVLTTGYGPETIRIHRNAENTGSSS